MGLGDGLVCEFSVCDGNVTVVVFDPVAKTTRALPALVGNESCRLWDCLPSIETVIDNVGFKVFLLRRAEGLPTTQFLLYESSTDAWRDLGTPGKEFGGPELSGLWCAESAVYFQGTFYANFYNHGAILLLSYNLEENCSKRVLAIEPVYPGYSELIVFNNRMFMTLWLDDELHGSLSGTEVRCDPYSRRSIFEIREIFENSSNSILKIPYLELQRIFYGEKNISDLHYDISFGFPINSDSVLMVSRRKGKLIIYNVMSGFVCELPAHPLRQAVVQLAKEKVPSVTFRAKLMKLSLRNILANSST